MLGSVGDGDGEPTGALEPYVPGTVGLASVLGNDYGFLAIVGDAGEPIWPAVPLQEREAGVLIAVPAGAQGAVPGAATSAAVARHPAALGEQINVVIIDVEEAFFGMLGQGAAFPADFPPQNLFVDGEEHRPDANDVLDFALAWVESGAAAGAPFATGESGGEALPRVPAPSGPRPSAAPAGGSLLRAPRARPGSAGGARQTVANVAQDVAALTARTAELEGAC